MTEELNTLLSVVVPMKDEEQNIQPLYEEICGALKGLDYEIIFVDDGSRDGTYSKLIKIHSEASNVKVIKLRRNFGKSGAYSEAFKKASGEYIATMDGDLQDAPDEIPRLLTKINEGYDLIVGRKATGKSSFIAFILSRSLNKLVKRLTRLDINDINCPMRLGKHEVFQNLNLSGAMYRYIPFIIANQGYKVCEHNVANRDRLHGQSKYSSSKYIGGALDLFSLVFIERFAEYPMRVFGIPAIICTTIGGGLAALSLVHVFGYEYTVDTVFLKTVFGTLLILLGGVFFSIGLLGELISRILMKEPNRVGQFLNSNRLTADVPQE